MITQQLKNELKAAAIEAYDRAYVPYSKFPVGAAILMRDGNIIKGCNIENCSYGLSNCAERTAMFCAVAQGYTSSDMLAIAIATPTDTLTTPCGACRQVMMELMGEDKLVILTNGKQDQEYLVKDLLPATFVL